MLAYRLLQAQTQPEFQEVPEPHPGPGQVVVKSCRLGLMPHRLHGHISRPKLLEERAATLHSRARDRGSGRRGGNRSDEVPAW